MDIRWQQRFDNYRRALATLRDGMEMAQTRELNDLEKQGLIQGFEFTHEVAWNVMKDYLKNLGIQDLMGSRDTTREETKV